MTAEVEVPVQDSARENQLISIFKLSRNPNRLGPDSYDEKGNPFELKTTTKTGVGTGRDVSFEMIQQWRQRYWVVAKGRNLASGFRIDSIYFLHPSMMEEALKKIEDHIQPDIQLGDKALSLLERKLCSDEAKRLRYLISRGATLNNPKIPWWYIEQKGIPISGDYASELRKLIEKYPLSRNIEASPPSAVNKIQEENLNSFHLEEDSSSFE